MSTVEHTTHSLGSGIAAIRSKWGWFVALGVGFLVLGGVAFANLMLATVASVYTIGVLMLIGGVVQMVHAFQVRGWSRFLFWMLGGLVYAAAGVLAFVNPLLASAVLTLMLASALIAAGILRTWAAIHARPERGWGWLAAAGVVTFVAGLVIALGWPVNSLWILGLVLAIDLVFQGWSFIAFGTALKVRA